MIKTLAAVVLTSGLLAGTGCESGRTTGPDATPHYESHNPAVDSSGAGAGTNNPAVTAPENSVNSGGNGQNAPQLNRTSAGEQNGGSGVTGH